MSARHCAPVILMLCPGKAIRRLAVLLFVMAGLVSAIHVFLVEVKDVDAGGKPAHDGGETYLIASGLTGEPTAPVIGMAGATNRNSYTPSAAQSSASSLTWKISPMVMPMIGMVIQCHGWLMPGSVSFGRTSQPHVSEASAASCVRWIQPSGSTEQPGASPPG